MSCGRAFELLQGMFISTICFCLIVNVLASQNGTVAEKKACNDKLPRAHCKVLAAGGACQTKIKRMMELCPRTCQFCDDYCKDFFSFLCPWWTFHGACYTHASVLNVYCRKSCGKCGLAPAPPKKAPCENSPRGCCWDMRTPVTQDGKCPECKDGQSFCKTFVRYCFYGINKPFMHKNCPETCRRCRRPKLNIKA